MADGIQKEAKQAALVVFGTICLAVLVSLFGTARADTGHEGAVRTELGSYGAMRLVYPSSTTGTAIMSATVKRPDSTCFNNTANAIWIGTVTATVNGRYHDNIVLGMPILSSTSFHIGGSYTGEWDATCAPGVSTCEMRCLDSLVR